jgi:hypothetical protein
MERRRAGSRAVCTTLRDYLRAVPRGVYHEVITRHFDACFTAHSPSTPNRPLLCVSPRPPKSRSDPSLAPFSRRARMAPGGSGYTLPQTERLHVGSPSRLPAVACGPDCLWPTEPEVSTLVSTGWRDVTRTARPLRQCAPRAEHEAAGPTRSARALHVRIARSPAGRRCIQGGLRQGGRVARAWSRPQRSGRVLENTRRHYASNPLRVSRRRRICNPVRGHHRRCFVDFVHRSSLGPHHRSSLGPHFVLHHRVSNRALRQTRGVSTYGGVHLGPADPP